MMTRNSIRKKIICLLATYLHQKPKPLSRPQEVEEIKEKEDEVSSDILINTIVMPIKITFDNPIDFNHFSKPKDFKKDLTVAFDSTKSSILPPPLLDSDSPFTAELSASITLNSLGNEDKVFKPGILVYHAIHDKNLVTLEKNLRENISSGTLLILKEPSSPRPLSEPLDVCMRFKLILAMKNDFVKPNEDFYLSETVLSLNIEDVDSFTFIIWTFLPYFTYPEDSPLIFSFRSLQKSTRLFHRKLMSLDYYSPDGVSKAIINLPHDGWDAKKKVINWGQVNQDVLAKLGTDISKITRKQSKTGKHGHRKRKSTREAKDSKPKPEKVKLQSNGQTSCMRTRSQARNRNRRQQQITTVIVEEPEIPMADNRTMAQMLQAPIEGYEDAIVVPPINANNFELKQPLINLVQSNKFTGRQDPHNHLRFFNKVTSMFRHPEVPNTSIKLLLFPFSLDGEARDWLDKEPPRSILTWDDLVSKFINQFFPPSKTTYLRNKITTFYQEPNETD
ncbi:reverse transcriptase domain-containing protein [Tanacetum coccineum]